MTQRERTWTRLPAQRMLVWLVLSHLVVFVLPAIALVGTGALGKDLRMQTKEDLEHQASLVALHLQQRIDGGADLAREAPALLELLPKAKAATLASFRVTGPDGVVVASSSGTGGQDLSRSREVAQALAGEEGIAYYERPPEDVSTTPFQSPSRRAAYRISLAMPIVSQGQVVGAVVVGRTPREELQTLVQMSPRLSLGILLALATTIALGAASGAVLSRSLNLLARVSNRVAGGNLAAVSELERTRRSHVVEARQLAIAMTTMTTRLQQRLGYISEFAGNVSHEFKTPVSALRGTIELLRDDEEMDPLQRRRFLSNALGDLDRLSRLVTGLLKLARAEEGADREPLDLGHLASSVVGNFPGVTFEGTGAAVLGNRDQLESVVVNLVENALHYGGPTIRVTAWSDADATGIDVQDDGAGISAANLPQVFQRFFTTDRAGGGTGLGLALVRAVCEAHGGTATVESKPGNTVFRVRLPRA